MKTEYEKRKEYLKYLMEKFSLFFDFTLFYNKMKESFTQQFPNKQFSLNIIQSWNFDYKFYIKEILTSTILKKFQKNIDNDFKEHISDEILSLIQEFGIIEILKLIGEKIYFISNKIIHLLSNTDINIKLNIIKFPFEAFIILFDKGIYFWEKQKEDDDRRDICGCYVSVIKYDKYSLLQLGLLLDIPTPENQRIFTIIPANFYLDDNIYSDLKSYLKDCQKVEKTFHNMSEINFSTYVKIFKLIINSILYITSRDADIIEQFPFANPNINQNLATLSRGQQRRLEQAKEKNSGNLPYYLVGSKIIEPTGQPLPSDPEYQPVNHLTTQHWRSGHWRWQWYGSEHLGDKHQEHIWIMPCLVGPDMAEIINVPRVVVA